MQQSIHKKRPIDITLIWYFIVIFFISRTYSLSISGKLFSIGSICISLLVIARYSFEKIRTKRLIDSMNDCIIIALLGFIFIWALITLINRGSLYAIAAAMYPIIAMACFFAVSVRRHPNTLLKAYAFYAFAILLINFIDMVFFSDLRIVDGRVATNQFFIGGINQFGVYIAFSMAVLLLYRNLINRKIGDILVTVSAVIILFMAYAVKSATTYVCVAFLILSAFTPILGIFRRLKNYVIFIGYISVWSMLIFSGQLSFISYFITTILHRNLTLTNRTLIWDNAFSQLSGHWLFGFGKQASGDVIELNGQFLSLHNEMLQIIFEGGLVLLAGFWLIFFLCTAKKRSKSGKPSSQSSGIVLAAIVTVLLCWLTEAPGLYVIFFLLILYSNMKCFKSSNNLQVLRRENIGENSKVIKWIQKFRK